MRMSAGCDLAISRTECWVGLVLSSPRGDERDQRDVHADGVLVACFELELTDRLQERQGLDVTDGSADLDDAMSAPRSGLHPRFDLVVM